VRCAATVGGRQNWHEAASDTKNIVIVGAGPAGLATALSPAEGGAGPLLFDATADRLRAPPDVPEPMCRAFDGHVARAGAERGYWMKLEHGEPVTGRRRLSR
jgi:2-polyprenyl-6-methoxyphenol hydroxylase-like FAD-dependent oxidoreductase